MKFLADENFPITSFRLLQEAGYDIKHIAFETPGVSDRVVTDFAISENRIILTFDGDYGTLIFKFGYQPPGVIYFRLTNISASEPAFILMNMLNENYQIDHMHTVIENEKVRQRRIL